MGETSSRPDARQTQARGGTILLRRARLVLGRLYASPWTRDFALLFVVALISVTWFRSAELIWTPDSNFPLDIPSSINRYFEVWDFRSIPGQTDARKLPFIVPWALLLEAWAAGSLPFSPPVFQRAVVLGLLWASEISAYILFQLIAAQLALGPVQRRAGGILAGLLYGFNFFSMLTIWSTLAYLMFGYAFLPLVMALVLRGLNRQHGTRYALLVALIWSLTLSPAYITPPTAITDWVSVWLISLVSLALSTLTRRSLWAGIRFLSETTALWTVLNVFWIAPLATLGVAELSRYRGSEGLFAWNAAPLADALRLAGYSGLTDSYKGSRFFPWAEWYANPWVVAAGFVPAALVIIAVARRRSPFVLGFGALWLIALFLVKGPLPPFGDVNEGLFGFGLLVTAYRSTYQRFMGYVALSIAVLAPVGAVELANVWARARQRISTRVRLPHLSPRTKTVAICMAIAVLSLTYTAPLVTGVIYENEGVIPSYRATLPPSWREVAAWLEAQGGEFTLFPFPYPVTSSGISLKFDNGSAGLLGLYPLVLLSSKPIAWGPGPGESLARLFVRGDVSDAKMFNILNVRFVLVHLDANMEDLDGSPHWVMDRPDRLLRRLNETPGLAYLRRFDKIMIYENTRWASSELIQVVNGADARGRYPVFVWNAMAGGIARWDGEAPKGVVLAGNQIVRMALPPRGSLGGNLSQFGVSRLDRLDTVEWPAPFWIENDPSGTPSRIWTRIVRMDTDTSVHVYASDRHLMTPDPAEVFPGFFDSFEGVPFEKWSSVGTTWTISRSLAVDGTASAVGGPIPSGLVLDKVVTSGAFEGWFRFGETNVRHYPFLPTDSSGNWNYWVVALEDGTWGYFDAGSYNVYPIRRTYQPNSWTFLRIEFDLSRRLFWTYVDDELLTPGGLPSANVEGFSGDYIVNARLQNAEAGSAGTMWVDDLRVRTDSEGEFTANLTNPRRIELNPNPLRYEVLEGSHTDIQLSTDVRPGTAFVWLRTFHPGWVLEVNGVPVPDSQHFLAYGYWNGWMGEWNGTVAVRIYFAPQRSWFLSFGLSLAAMGVSSAYLAYAFVANKMEARRRKGKAA